MPRLTKDERKMLETVKHRMINSTNYRNFKCCPQCVDPLLNCPDQANAHRVPENELSDSEARSTSKNFALRIEVARKHLGNDLEEYGDQIFSRWKKWPRVKREAMLRQVEPEMEDTSYRYTEDPLWGQGVTFRTSKLLYLDVEILRDNPMRLLSLMHYRFTYTPGEWVPPLHKVISLQMVKKQCEMVRDASRIEMQSITLGNGAVRIPSDRALFGLYNETYALLQTMWGPDAPESKTAVAFGRTKPKTRPAEAVLQDISNEETVRRGISAIKTPFGGLQDRIPVNTNSLRVLAMLFGVGKSKATVKWQEIVTALTDAGMVAMNSGGSAVTFKLLSESDSGSPRIVFHKPHPDPGVCLIQQLWMGKRLNKWFGWDAGTFVERQKSSTCV
ncbi:hypothetical protein TI39_contig4345g00002 [Zymoseptoria brevis]|uniref:Uncharacterized protein n=1 Tax=Zymoseptoria brevis TaxID=1047168 RepID=A0A0F4G8C2_9PEZI|nr:hypothetical protein TI39_contig4345g00002 [Zymoseptoria brevis]